MLHLLSQEPASGSQASGLTLPCVPSNPGPTLSLPFHSVSLLITFGPRNLTRLLFLALCIPWGTLCTPSSLFNIGWMSREINESLIGWQSISCCVVCLDSFWVFGTFFCSINITLCTYLSRYILVGSLFLLCTSPSLLCVCATGTHAV